MVHIKKIFLIKKKKTQSQREQLKAMKKKWERQRKQLRRRRQTVRSAGM